jgi:hypothetical protein
MLTIGLLLIVVSLAYFALRLLGRGRLRSRTTTRTPLPGLRASVRGLTDVRSIYIPLGFGYRWEIYKAETEAQRAARIRRENREAIRRAREERGR